MEHEVESSSAFLFFTYTKTHTKVRYFFNVHYIVRKKANMKVLVNLYHSICNFVKTVSYHVPILSQFVKSSDLVILHSKVIRIFRM